MSKRNETLEIGCHFDGSRGIYIGEAVQELATEYGWTGESVDSEHDEYHDAWTEAEDYLQAYVPDYCYIGSNDSGDWGVWIDWGSLNEDSDILKVSDLSEVSAKYRGIILHVNDHGNATLYNKTAKETFREIWAVV